MRLPFVSRRTHKSACSLYSVALDDLRRDYAYERNRAAAFESILREAETVLRRLHHGYIDPPRVQQALNWIHSMLKAHGEREREERKRQAREEARS